MRGLVLNRQLNHRNIRLDEDTQGESVGYLLADGERRFVRWLGFISREHSRSLPRAKPVRLVDISRYGHECALNVSWSDVPRDRYVYGCLTEEGAYAVYEASVVIVPAPTVFDVGVDRRILDRERKRAWCASAWFCSTSDLLGQSKSSTLGITPTGKKVGDSCQPPR